MENEHRIPLLHEHVDALLKVCRQSSFIGDGWVFPSPDDASQPISRRQTVPWWRLLEKRAKLDQKKGRGWHSLRRKFANDNDGIPLARLMALGGWKSSVVEIYQKPSDEKLREALATRARARKASKRADATTASDKPQCGGVPSSLPEVASGL